MRKGKYLRRKQIIVNIPICLAVVLFWLVAITTYMSSGLYAKYSTSGSGADNARVANFGTLTMTESGDFDGTAGKKGMIIPGVDLTKKVEVSFTGSEMATIVFVEVSLSNHWQKASDSNTFTANTNFLSWTVADGWTFLEDTQYVFYKELPPNKVLNPVDFIGNGGCITVSDTINDYNIATLEGIQINLQASVIQSGGFETIADAWAVMGNKSN